jgi:hypothetical protein
MTDTHAVDTTVTRCTVKIIHACTNIHTLTLSAFLVGSTGVVALATVVWVFIQVYTLSVAIGKLRKQVSTSIPETADAIVAGFAVDT